jgi:hypothetical protein
MTPDPTCQCERRDRATSSTYRAVRHRVFRRHRVDMRDRRQRARRFLCSFCGARALGNRRACDVRMPASPGPRSRSLTRWRDISPKKPAKATAHADEESAPLSSPRGRVASLQRNGPRDFDPTGAGSRLRHALQQESLATRPGQPRARRDRQQAGWESFIVSDSTTSRADEGSASAINRLTMSSATARRSS